LCSTDERPPQAPHFPYTTLFRSGGVRWVESAGGHEAARRERAAAPAARGRRAGADARGARSRAALATRLPAAHRHAGDVAQRARSEEHTSELQSRVDLVCRLLLE